MTDPLMDERWRWWESRVVLMSVGPEGEAWLDENAPDWRKHVTLRAFVARDGLSRRMLQASATPERDLIREQIVPRLHNRLVRAIVDAMEPGIEELEGLGR